MRCFPNQPPGTAIDGRRLCLARSGIHGATGHCINQRRTCWPFGAETLRTKDSPLASVPGTTSSGGAPSGTFRRQSRGSPGDPVGPGSTFASRVRQRCCWPREKRPRRPVESWASRSSGWSRRSGAAACSLAEPGLRHVRHATECDRMRQNATLLGDVAPTVTPLGAAQVKMRIGEADASRSLRKAESHTRRAADVAR